MKEKLTRNIGLKILSIILAAFIWLIITNVDDPITPKYFPNVKVEILNANEITALNQVYEITEGATIDFTAAARRSVVETLTESDFTVTADLSKLSDLKTVTINISYNGLDRDGVKIRYGLNQVMKVNKEELEEGHFQVYVQQTGELSEGCYVYEKTANTILRVKGPKSKIDNIKEVVVDVDVTDYTKSFTTNEQPRVLDAKGKEIDPSNLTFSKTVIPVFIGMYKTKTVNLNVITTGSPADGYIVSGVEYEPKTIEIAAEDNVLNNINEITLEENIDGQSANIEKELNIQEQLQEGVFLVGDNQTAVVNIAIEAPETKEITFLPSDIRILNKPNSLKLDYLTKGSITLKVSGPAKEIKEITKRNLDPYINLSNYGSGTYSVRVGADFEGYAQLENRPTVNIQLATQ